uniref:C2H2-type domain-containing protein n=1 Tax=Anopheles melas TaxID=34690 RepID=A0A182TH40_9DIPT
MDQVTQPYEGVHCDECQYWFSKLYLFKQHHRKCHSDLGELIDLPPLPAFANTVKLHNLEDELWFAILHTYEGKTVLMRIFEAETHATMRIANQRDMEQQRKRLVRKGAGDTITIGVLYDVYPEINAEDTLSFKVVPRIYWDVNEDGTKTPIPSMSYPVTGRSGHRGQYPRNFLFPENLNTRHEPASYIYSDVVLCEHNAPPNPFYVELERILRKCLSVDSSLAMRRKNTAESGLQM